MGPLDGMKVIEVAGIGPGPFCAMMLADMGAEVIRVDRASRVRPRDPATPPADVLNRGRRSVAIDLGQPDGIVTLLRLVEQADAVIEGFRPGVAERLGFGPEVCLERNPNLVYGRMTGWGQDGPLAQAPGHDINYIALAGVLGLLGRAGEPPAIPLNLVGDFGGGGMLLAFGVLAGIHHVSRGGRGQVVDAAMVDGSALLSSMMHGLRAEGAWRDRRGTNVIDSGAHFYEVYETKDGRFVAVGAIESKFYGELLEIVGLGDADTPNQWDQRRWPEMKDRLAEVFRSRTRDEWDELLLGTDACYAPVLELSEVGDHPHNAARGTFIDVAGITQPAPAPRFSQTSANVQRPPAHPGQHTLEVLAEWGWTDDEIAALHDSGAVESSGDGT
jgi:alpha-methylacyl-CoA racemase